MISIGGARIGWVNATWPFAILSVEQNGFEINATLIGKYSFVPEQIISFTKHTVIPFLGWGIKINHIAAEYPKHIVFWCLGNPENLIRKINKNGFVPKASMSDPAVQSLSDRGVPVRWQTVVILIAIWNGLIMLDTFPHGMERAKPGLFSLLAFLLFFVGSLGVLRLKWLQRLVLKEGRKPTEIQHWLKLLGLVSGLMLWGIGLDFVL